MKLYTNEAWLKDRYQRRRMSLEAIAKEAGCTPMTVYNWLQKYGLIRNSRA